MVANSIGLNQYLDGRQLCQGLQTMISRTGTPFHTDIPEDNDISGQKVYPPRGFEAAAPNSLSDPATLDPDALLGINLPDSYAHQVPILWPRSRNEIIDTDGSARDTGHPDYYRSGTGIFRFVSPAGPALEMRIDPTDE